MIEPNPRALEASPNDGADESERLARDELAQLASAARDGDTTAFEELVRRTHKSTYTLALRLTANEEDARDVTQEVYLRAYKGLKNYRGDAQITTWLYRITANCASTFLTTRSRHRHQDIADLNEPAEDVVVVAIDEASLAELGRWPWSQIGRASCRERV